MDLGLSALLKRPDVWRGGEAARVTVPSIPTGFPALDALLPGGGWPRGALTEILPERDGIGEFSLLAPALARLSRQDLWLAFIAPPHLPYAPALAAAGIDLAQVVMIRPEKSGDILWAMEQTLRSGSCSAILAWPPLLTERGARRLQLAAEAGGSWGVYFSPATLVTAASPAALRLALYPTRGKPVEGGAVPAGVARKCDPEAGSLPENAAGAPLASTVASPRRGAPAAGAPLASAIASGAPPPSSGKLRIAILKRRGSAVPAPLLLDVPRPGDTVASPTATLEWK
jgi:cell division inhibitor SulA/protein ImuA